MLGRAAIAMWWGFDPAMQPEIEDWHSHEHFPERLGIPGFLRGSRWVRGTSYFVLYEVDSLATLTGGAYMERLNAPTPWSRKMMPHHRNMVRSLCLVRASSGRGLSGCMASVRLDRATPLPELKGITGAQLLESQPMAALPQTTEQKIRGGDAQAHWILLLNGYDAELVAAAAGDSGEVGLYRLSYSL